MEIKDVRLVYAPALGIGDFGGETDNWMWPRHTGDWSYLRAYVGKDGKPADFSKDNVPYHPAHLLKVSTESVNPGDFVLVAGYPGRTFRYRTAAEVGNMQSYSYPMTVKYATDLNNILRDLGKNNKAVEIANASRIKGNDNVLKNYTGTLTGFNNFHIVAQRPEARSRSGRSTSPRIRCREVQRRDEPDQRAAAAVDRQPAARHGAELDRAQLADAGAGVHAQSPFDREGQDGRHRSRGRLPAARLAAHHRGREPRAEEPRAEQRPRRPALLPQRVAEASRPDSASLPIDEAIAKAGGVEPFLDQLYANTKIGDLSARKAMMDETTAQLAARNDSMLNLAAAITPLSLDIERQQKELGGAHVAHPSDVHGCAAHLQRRPSLSRRQRHAARHVRQSPGLHAARRRRLHAADHRRRHRGQEHRRPASSTRRRRSSTPSAPTRPPATSIRSSARFRSTSSPPSTPPAATPARRR